MGGNYKKSMYPQIVEWGFVMYPCSETYASKGYPYCGPNSLYEWAEMGYNGLEDRERSDLFKYSAGDLTTPSADANSADQIETDPYAGDPELSVDQSSGSSSHDNSESSHDNTDTCSTIFDLACSTDGFDTFCGLLTSFDLKDAISGGSWTVFAPTDEAFTKLDDALEGGIASVSDDLLLKILQFHVVEDQVLHSDDLSCEPGNNIVVRHVQLVHQPDARAAGDPPRVQRRRQGQDEEQVPEQGVPAAEGARREGRAPAPLPAGRQPDRAQRGAGRVHRRLRRRPVQAAHLPLLDTDSLVQQSPV